MGSVRGALPQGVKLQITTCNFMRYKKGAVGPNGRRETEHCCCFPVRIGRIHTRRPQKDNMRTARSQSTARPDLMLSGMRMLVLIWVNLRERQQRAAPLLPLPPPPRGRIEVGGRRERERNRPRTTWRPHPHPSTASSTETHSSETASNSPLRSNAR